MYSGTLYHPKQYLPSTNTPFSLTMGDSSISVESSSRMTILADAIGEMSQSFGVVMGWQKVEVPSRLLIGSRTMRKLTNRIRQQPIYFIITVHQSLETAKEGQCLCRRGSKASRILLGEEDHPERVTSQFIDKTVKEIKKFASDLKEYTKEIYNRFRLLRRIVLDIHKDLDNVTSDEQRSAFFARLSRYLSKDFRTCEDTLRRVHDDLGKIVRTLYLIVRWWQKVENEANYMQMNGVSSLANKKNAITIREIRDSFITLDSCFDGYVDQMGALYDENIVNLSIENRKNLAKVGISPDLMFSGRGLLESTNCRPYLVLE